MKHDFLAYSPTIYLVESHVACYKIYTLTNPINNDIFYVGQTVLSLQERLYGHLNQTGGSNRDKINYIKEILSQGLKPIIKEVETIHTKCYIDKASVNERENYWIKYYRSIGCVLFNIATPKNYEYQSYISSIKRGETSTHYYYCGKTAGGYSVYDEVKLKADGFSLWSKAQPDYKAEERYEHPYNPLEYDKYRLKVGLPEIERPNYSINRVTTDVFPEQPAWSVEFAKGIPPYNSLKVEMFLEMQVDNCDLEYDELELDMSDYELTGDDEPDCDSEETLGCLYEHINWWGYALYEFSLPKNYYVTRLK